MPPSNPHQKKALDRVTAAHVAELFRALGDPSRVRIIAALIDGELNVSTLAEIVDLSESAVSHHMRGLRQMRLVRSRREGRQVFYNLDDEHIVELFNRGLDHVLHDRNS
jgi:DNA-binding transcriptional ArsR family regulator